MGDAFFLPDTIPNVQVIAPNQIPNWAAPNFGATANDNNLETAMASIRWAGNPTTVDLNVSGLLIGETYTAQILVNESCCLNRGFDVIAEGALIVDDYSTAPTQPANVAGVISHTFVAGDNTFNLQLNGAPTGFGDKNPILSGFTLEHVGANPNGVSTVGTFSGADAGEGLDFSGDFTHAINVGGPAATVGDASFASGNPGDLIPNATVTSVNHIPGWSAPNFGASGDDDALETVMQSIRWTGNTQGSGSVGVDLENVTPGDMYKLQLLFTEACCGRGFDVLVDGVLIEDDFSPNALVAANAAPTEAAFISYEFTAIDDTVNILLNGLDTPFADQNPILSAVTLESIAVPEPASIALWTLLGCAVAGCGWISRRRRK